MAGYIQDVYFITQWTFCFGNWILWRGMNKYDGSYLWNIAWIIAYEHLYAEISKLSEQKLSNFNDTDSHCLTVPR